MPFVEIPSASLPHLPLFGYDQIAEDGDFIWYAGPKGRTRVNRHRPVIWLEDETDALQLGAVAIIPGPGKL